MLSGLLVHITTFLTSIGLGNWIGSQSGGRIDRGRSTSDPQVLLLSNEIDSWMSLPEPSMNNMPYHLHQVLNALNGSSAFEYEASGTDRVFRSSSTLCNSCRILAKMVVGYVKLGGPIDVMAKFLIKICYIVGYQSLTVCGGIINQDKDRLEWILHNTNTNADEICSLMLGSYGCGPFLRAPWTVNLPPSDSKHLDQSYSPASLDGRVHAARHHSEPYQEPQHQAPFYPMSSGKRVLKVLHLTDPHYDPDYAIGSNAVCEAPLCCNPESGRVRRLSDAAGKWGDYRSCDSPKWLLENMLQHITANHKDIDYVLCTGDTVPHHIWKITERENIAIMKEMTQLLLKYFKDVPIYSTVGNHDSAPRDSFPPPEVPEVWSRYSIQWLYDALSEEWAKLMKAPTPPSASYAGYYSVLVRPGFRIISINTNYCYRLNWWLLYKSVDPGLVLRWLVNELQNAERRGELVHLIGHVPPFYSDCFVQWSHQFSRVVSRFSHIIRGQFYGHSHLDEFRVHYDVHKPTKPIGVQYVTPNNGPFQELNPSYRIFYVDGDHHETTRHVLDYETWVLNLTHANKYDAPYWYQMYSARRDLSLPSLEPQDWDQFVMRMARDPALFARYYRYQVQDSDVFLKKGCDEKCRRKTLCSIVEGDKFLPPKCRQYR